MSVFLRGLYVVSSEFAREVRYDISPSSVSLNLTRMSSHQTNPFEKFSIGHLGDKFKLIDRYLTPPYKGHVEIGYLTKFGALRLDRDQVMTLETWFKIDLNACNFVTTSPKAIINS